MEKKKNLKRKIVPVLAVIGIIFLIIAIIAGSYFIKKYTPSKDRMGLNEYFQIESDDQVAIIYNNKQLDSYAKAINGHVYLDYHFIQEYINGRFYWDSNENILLYTTSTDLISAPADGNNYYVGKSAVDFGRPVVKATSESAYVDIEFVKNYSDFTYEVYEDPWRTCIQTEYGSVETATAKKDTEIRKLGGIKSPILADIAKNDKLTILAADTKWTKVMTANGIPGYIRTNCLSATTTETTTSTFVPETFSHIQKDFEINMAWHQVTTTAANADVTNILARSKGINVLSPTWFYLNDNNGNIKDIGSTDYVNYCHQQGIEVWALVSNLENQDVDCSYVLTHTSTRQNLVNQIVAVAIQYNLDGINVDFEALNENKVGDSFIQFIRELSLKCSNNGIVLSVDNYVPFPYTAFYNRAEQALFADYVVIMAYDEHYAGSEEAGSVASLNWVKDGVSKTLNEVPANQVILGMPFYTRIWTLTPTNTTEEGSDSETMYDITSYACGMQEAARMAEINNATVQWDAECGQNYVEYTTSNGIVKYWMEDASSIEEKLKVVTDNKLAGASYWKLGFETDNIWDVIIKYIN